MNWTFSKSPWNYCYGSTLTLKTLLFYSYILKIFLDIRTSPKLIYLSTNIFLTFCKKYFRRSLFHTTFIAKISLLALWKSLVMEIPCYMHDSAYRWLTFENTKILKIMLNSFEFSRVKGVVGSWLVYADKFSRITQSCFLTETIKQS